MLACRLPFPRSGTVIARLTGTGIVNSGIKLQLNKTHPQPGVNAAYVLYLHGTVHMEQGRNCDIPKEWSVFFFLFMEREKVQKPGVGSPGQRTLAV
jgi:hypothetical protein